jgi:hypothetical protein
MWPWDVIIVPPLDHGSPKSFNKEKKMTLKVTIEHSQPGYDKSVQVQAGVFDQKENTFVFRNETPIVIPPGGSAWFYVHSTQDLLVKEVPNAV